MTNQLFGEESLAMDATNSPLSEPDTSAKNVMISTYALLATKKRETPIPSKLWKDPNALSLPTADGTKTT
jgi:hypothetical protein